MFVEDLAIYNSEYVQTEKAVSNRNLTSKGVAFSQFINLKQLAKCPFAKGAVIVDHVQWDESISFNENLNVIANNLATFCDKCEEYRLDGFLVTASSSYSRSAAMLGEFLRRILFYLSEHDPTGVSSLTADLNDPKWRYRYSHMFFFIATFSPCYSLGSSRSSQGVDQTIIIFQPKTSFNRSLSGDRTTKFAQREYIRDKFCVAGAPYNLRDLERERFVSPHEYNNSAVEWWKPNLSFNFEDKSDVPTYSRQRACVLM